MASVVATGQNPPACLDTVPEFCQPDSCWLLIPRLNEGVRQHDPTTGRRPPGRAHRHSGVEVRQDRLGRSAASAAEEALGAPELVPVVGVR